MDEAEAAGKLPALTIRGLGPLIRSIWFWGRDPTIFVSKEMNGKSSSDSVPRRLKLPINFVRLELLEEVK